MVQSNVWSPVTNGLSVSGLELWLVDREAFHCYYLRNLEAVETWNKNMSYGSLCQAGIEGFIKTRTRKGAANFIHKEFDKQLQEYAEYEEIAWWTGLAQKQIDVWIDRYGSDIDTYGVTESEKHHKIELELPSRRKITLHGFIDGEGSNILIENKCRGEYNEEAIAREIDRNLQYNMYCLFFKTANGSLPRSVWYQHLRRPCGYGYCGPRQKAKETPSAFRDRLGDAIKETQDYHFFRYWGHPTEGVFNRFLHLMLYPMLENFMNWYEYIIRPHRELVPNDQHWATPYGLYNPFMEGTQERYRNYRLTGSTLGLRPRIKR